MIKETALVRKFNKFHSQNPTVYELFKRFSFKAMNTGHVSFSAWAIMNRIRWECDIETISDDRFKISNDFIALYARKFMEDYPYHEGFFQTKPMKRA